MENYALFPSGRTVNRCKQDAKKLVKQAKALGHAISHHQALDEIAKRNGINRPWHKALEILKRQFKDDLGRKGY